MFGRMASEVFTGTGMRLQQETRRRNQFQGSFEKSKDAKSKTVAACSQIWERHRVFSQIKGVAQRARTPLSGTLLPNLVHLGYRMAVRKTAIALRKDKVSLRGRRRWWSLFGLGIPCVLSSSESIRIHIPVPACTCLLPSSLALQMRRAITYATFRL
jgi:hypothetical protein